MPFYLFFSRRPLHFSLFSVTLFRFILLPRCSAQSTLGSSSASSARGILPQYSQKHLNRSRITSTPSPQRFRRQSSVFLPHFCSLLRYRHPFSAIGQAPRSFPLFTNDSLVAPLFWRCSAFLGLEFVETSSPIGRPILVMQPVPLSQGLGHAPSWIK